MKSVSPISSALSAINHTHDYDKGNTRSVIMPSGRVVEIATAPSESIRVSGRHGDVELAIQFTDDGPVLKFNTADIDLASTGQVSIDCQDFEVKAKKHVSIQAGGDINTHADGNCYMTVKRVFELLADSLDLEAENGDASVKANDIVHMLGEKILLNSESEDDNKDKIVAFLDRLSMRRDG